MCTMSIFYNCWRCIHGLCNTIPYTYFRRIASNSVYVDVIQSVSIIIIILDNTVRLQGHILMTIAAVCYVCTYDTNLIRTVA